MSNRWKQSKVFWARFYFAKYILPGAIVLGIIILAIFLFHKTSNWVVSWSFWKHPFLEWLQTATIGEVALFFGGLLFVVRTLTTSSVTVKQEK